MTAQAKKAILLGLDGFDPVLMNRFIAEEYLPNLKKVMDRGVTMEGSEMFYRSREHTSGSRSLEFK